MPAASISKTLFSSYLYKGKNPSGTSWNIAGTGFGYSLLPSLKAANTNPDITGL